MSRIHLLRLQQKLISLFWWICLLDWDVPSSWLPLCQYRQSTKGSTFSNLFCWENNISIHDSRPATSSINKYKKGGFYKNSYDQKPHAITDVMIIQRRNILETSMLTFDIPMLQNGHHQSQSQYPISIVYYSDCRH